MGEDFSWIERLKASPLGRAEYRLKCWFLRLFSPLERRSDRRYLDSLAQKIKKLSEKPQVRVLFFAMHPAYWRCDSLYKAMLSHPRFSPVILVCGGVEHGKAAMLRDARIMADFLEERGYGYKIAYNDEDDSWLDIRKEIDPDVFFYVKPYKGILPSHYEFDQFLDKLFVHLPYGIQTTNMPELCNTRYCRLSWMQFYETTLVFQNSPVEKHNTRITGSTKVDAFLERKNQGPVSPWKVIEGKENVKRVIWAPHHSIDGGSLGYSNFLTIADDFLLLARQFSGKVQFAFKPHPLLRNVLYGHKKWGKKRTDAYYKAWADGENLQVEEGDYVDLFLTSDAMIHDCGSFTVEYLMTQHPVMYLSKEHHDETLNGFGIASYELHYHGQSMNDISHFIQSVVIEGNDPKKSEREAFYKETLLPPNGKSAAQNMIDEFLKFTV